MKTYRFQLRPTSPWATPWHADSLFGAIAWRCAEAFGEELLLEWLDRFGNEDPPFVLSDALPGDWFPAPVGPAYQVRLGGKAKPPVWVRAADFQAMLADPTIQPESVAAGEMTEHADRRQAAMGRDSGRVDDGGDLFEVKQMILSAESGGFFSLYARAAEAQTIETLIQLLSLTGFGKKSSTGLGAFTIEGEPEPCEWLDERAGRNGFLSLSHFVPARKDPRDGAWRHHVSYPKYHGSAVQHPWKGRLIQLTPGSWFLAGGEPRAWYGHMVEAACAEYPRALHYGLAFAAPALFGTA